MNIKVLAALILTLLCAASCATLRTAPAPYVPYMGDNYQLILIATL
jgi:hypothetical protein